MKNKNKYSMRPISIILVAIEPRAYAHTIGAVIGELRPHLDTRIIEPEDLDCRIQSLSPELVLCSRPQTCPATGGLRWVEYRPYAEAPEAKVRIDETVMELKEVTLMDLLEIVDLAVPLRTAPEWAHGGNVDSGAQGRQL